MIRAGGGATNYGAWPVLFTDRYFRPAFGMGYETLSASPEVGQALLAPLRAECGDMEVEDLHLRTALTLAFGVDRQSEMFGSKAQKFRLAVDRARAGQEHAARLDEDIAALPSTPESVDRIAALRTELATLELLDSDAAALSGRLDETEAQISRIQGDAFLTALVQGQKPATTESLTQALALLDGRASDDRARWLRRLDGAARTVAEGIGENEAQLAAVQDLAVFPPVAEALEQAEDNRLQAEAAAKSALSDRIASLTHIGELRPVLAAIGAAGNDPVLLADYDAKARELLAAAVGPLPETA